MARSLQSQKSSVAATTMKCTLVAITLLVMVVEGNVFNPGGVQTGHFLIVDGNRSVEKLDLEKGELRDQFCCASLCLSTPRCTALWTFEAGVLTHCELYEVDRRYLNPNGRNMYIGQVDDYEPCQADYVMGYPEELLPIDARTFDDRLYGLTKRITGINIWAGYIVDRVQLIYDDVVGLSRGAPNGGNLKTMNMSDGEVISKIVVERHNGIPYETLANLTGKITITTSIGKSEVFGWGGGAGTFTLQGSELRWMSGWEGNRLYRINFAFMDSCNFVST